MPQATLEATQDARVVQNDPDATYGTFTLLAVDSEIFLTDPRNERLFLEFSLANLPADAETITAATLRLTPTTHTTGRTLACHEITEGWDETTITWNTQPTTAATGPTTPSTDTPHEWDVTDAVQAADPTGLVGFRIKDQTEDDTGDARQEYDSHDSTGTGPELILTYETSQATQLATTVSPILDGTNALPTQPQPRLDSNPSTHGPHTTLEAPPGEGDPDIEDYAWDPVRNVMWAVDIQTDPDGNARLLQYDQHGTLLAAYKHDGSAPTGTPRAGATNGNRFYLIEDHNQAPNQLLEATLDDATQTYTITNTRDFGADKWIQTIAYDATEDTFWIAWDDNDTLEKWDATFDTLLDTLTVDISGITAPNNQPFLLGRDGNHHIARIDKTTGTIQTTFAPHQTPQFTASIELWGHTWLGQLWYAQGLHEVQRLTSNTLASRIHPANIANQQTLPSTLLIETNDHTTLTSTFTLQQAHQTSLPTTLTPTYAAHATLETQAKPNIGQDTDLPTLLIPQLAKEIPLSTTITVQHTATTTLPSTVAPTLFDIPARARITGQITSVLLVNETDFADISNEAGSSITWTQNGTPTHARRIIQLIPSRSAAAFPREATSQPNQSSTQDELRRGDAILYAVDGDVVRPGDTIQWQGHTWRVIGGLGWEMIGDVRLYQEVGLRRLPVTTKARITGGIA